jgi:HPt (histidine-containing phosphotransfer) domain-containing protein
MDAVVSDRPAPAPAPASTVAGTGLVNRDALLSGFAGRTDLLMHVIEVFLEDAPVLLARLATAIKAGNGAEIASTAHSLKGSVGLFAQGKAYEATRGLEQLGRSGELENAETARAEVEAGVTELMHELRNLMKGLAK